MISYFYTFFLLAATIDFQNILCFCFFDDLVLLNNADWFSFKCNATHHSSALTMKHAHDVLTIFCFTFLRLHYVCNLNALIHGHSDV